MEDDHQTALLTFTKPGIGQFLGFLCFEAFEIRASIKLVAR